MWINPPLKIGLNKCTISSCLFDKNYSKQQSKEITGLYIIKLYIWETFLSLFSLSTVGTSGRRDTE